MIAPVTWSDERIERLTNLWRAGKSANEIAIDLGGVSRNAVMGKVHRLSLHKDAGHSTVAKERKSAADKKRSARRQQIDRDRAAREERRKIAAREKAEKLEKIAASRPTPLAVLPGIPRPDPLNVTLIDLGHGDCRFPVGGEKAGTLFCGHGVESGEVYCTYHCSVAYIPRELRVKKRAA